jgi:hypothetical protein
MTAVARPQDKVAVRHCEVCASEMRHLAGSGVVARPGPREAAVPMTSGNRMQVVFSCLNCKATFGAVQQHRQGPQNGQFCCDYCRSLVHRWLGTYDYVDWRAFQTPRDKRDTEL